MRTSAINCAKNFGIKSYCVSARAGGGVAAVQTRGEVRSILCGRILWMAPA